MTFKPKAYPFPVLQQDFPNFLESEIFDVTFKLSIYDEDGNRDQRLGCDVTLKNEAIEELILSEDVFIGAELYCRATFERRLLNIGMGTEPVDLNGIDLLDNVEITPVLVAKNDLPAYVPKNVVAEFAAKKSFSILSGDVLAYGITKFFDVSLDHTAQPDLVRIEPIKDQPPHWFDFELEGPVITIKLSTQLMVFWQKLKQDKPSKPYLYTNIYRDCIHAAIEYIKNNDGGELLWCKVLSNQINRLGIDLDSRDARDVANELVFGKGFAKVINNVDSN
jgi:hypothetical protein